MAFDAFLKVDGFPGESPDDKHKNEIVLQSYALGVSNAGTAASGTAGLGGGKSTFNDLACTFYSQKCSPKILVACAAGDHFNKAVLTVRKQGGTQIDYQVVTMTNCTFSSFNTGGAASGTEHSGTLDSVTINFSEITFEYKEQTSSGGAGPTTKGVYNVASQKKG
jgi:type VI secretion system secreted protein Hcp